MASADITPNVVNRLGELAFALCRAEAERDALGEQVRHLSTHLHDLQGKYNDLEQVAVSSKTRYLSEIDALKNELRELRASSVADNTNSQESDTPPTAGPNVLVPNSVKDTATPAVQIEEV